jgi:hypothetical protein
MAKAASKEAETSPLKQSVDIRVRVGLNRFPPKFRMYCMGAYKFFGVLGLL